MSTSEFDADVARSDEKETAGTIEEPTSDTEETSNGVVTAAAAGENAASMSNGSDLIAYCKIHPAIGIARVGNSPDAYFIGPESPGVRVAPPGGYKDLGDPEEGVPPRVKRQGARFRVYAYDKDHNVLGEITSAGAEISWTVHLANKKPEWDGFAGIAGEELPLGQRRERGVWRNKEIEDRDSLIIDPGPRTVTGANQTATFDGGKFRGIEVPLGNLRTDAEGRLLVLGGFGRSGASKPSAKIIHYANNDYWYDDVSDGPVSAKVTLKDGKEIGTVEPSWIIVGPPDFGPSITNIVTLYDAVVDVALRNGMFGPSFRASSSTPSFTREIYPIFARVASLQWVQQSALEGKATTIDLRNVDLLASQEPQVKEIRERVFSAFRNPHLDPDGAEAKKQANDLYIPALSGDGGDATVGRPRRWLTFTRTQYDALKKWRDGDFVADWNGEPEPRDEGITPEGLDRATLEASSGGAFYPGIEAGWFLRNPDVYEEPFRLSHGLLKAGDLTKQMACPWQADFFECRETWWPTQRPDDVLTYETYQQIVALDEKLSVMDPTSAERKRLEAERDRLWSSRVPWARGLPPNARPDGDMAMARRWHQHGFVVSSTQEGTLELGGVPQMVERERGPYDGLTMPEYFHILTNVEQHPDFLPKARELALNFFANANFDADQNYARFEYSPEAFDRRMNKIYDEYVLQMNERSWLDTGSITYPVVVRQEGDREITKNKKFEVGPFTDRVVREQLRQLAPFNLVDGAWLQRIQSVGPSDEVKAHLFAIWDDEAGNGRVEQNHCNVYDTLLRSLNIYMPPITAREFIERDLLPSAFTQAVFQLCVGLFPEEFFPEILGMTLYLEWEASPTLTPAVRLYEGRRIDAHFYRLHVAIDNITEGHGALAKEAIKLYLAEESDEGGSEAVQELWQRIWRGYVTWATAGGMGREFRELALLIDHKQIDLSYPMMIVPETIKNVSSILAKLKAANKDPLSEYLVSRFKPATQRLLRDSTDPPSQALVGALVDELNLVIQGENLFTTDRFVHVRLSDETRRLLASRPRDEELVRLNRTLLEEAYPDEIAEIPEVEPVWFPDYKTYYRQKMIDLVQRKAKAAKPLHRDIAYGGRNLAELFDDPEQLLDTLLEAGFFDKDHPRDSTFFGLLEFSGPMYKIFTEAEKDTILDWVESLREQASSPPPVQGTPAEWAVKVEQIIKDYAPTARTIEKHGDFLFPDEQENPKSIKEWVDNPRGLMAALKRGDDPWVEPHNSAGSRFYQQFVGNGPMVTLGSTVTDTIKQWIDTGALVPGEAAPTEALPAVSGPAQGETVPAVAFAATRAPVGGEPTIVSAVTAEGVRRGFAEKRRLIGMGSVH